MSVCLDSFAVLAWLQDEPGSGLVEQSLAAARDDESEACYISTINLGEVYYRMVRKRGEPEADRFWKQVNRRVVPVTPIDATRRRVREAAALKGRHPIAFADAFALQLARELSLPLLTADPEIWAVHEAESVEVLWPSPPRR